MADEDRGAIAARLSHHLSTRTKGACPMCGATRWQLIGHGMLIVLPESVLGVPSTGMLLSTRSGPRVVTAGCEACGLAVQFLLDAMEGQ